MKMPYPIRVLLGLRRYDIELTTEGGSIIIRNLPERMLDTVIYDAIDKGRALQILRAY